MSLEEAIAEAEQQIGVERLAGNIVKEEFWRGQVCALQWVRDNIVEKLMKTEPNEGAFARPSSQFKNPANGTTVTDEASKGLTKREYMAALAMQGLLARSDYAPLREVAEEAVDAAEELIEALNKPSGE